MSNSPRSAAARRAVSFALLAIGATFAAACGDSATGTASDDVAFARSPKNANTVQVNISGLPTGANASVSVTGSGGFSATLTSSATLTELANGSFTVNASAVSANGVTYNPTPATQSVSVNKGSTATANVVYGAAAAATGSLAVTVTIASGVPASVSVSGPNGYARALSASSTLTDLAAGSYTVNAAVVTSGSTTYTPEPASQTIAVTAGSAAAAVVTYSGATSPEPTGLNLQIAGMYVTQSVQTLSGAVPLVAGRDAMLRVFAVANGSNTVQPNVRARVYRNGTLVSTLEAAAPSASVPTTLNEGSATASWNIRLPGTLVGGGLTIIADVDAANAVTESVESDNSYPASGTPMSFDVRNVPALSVRFVPVLQSSTGQLGNVTDANSAAFLARLRDMHPVSTVSSNVRAAYTTSRTITNNSSEWSAVLSEVRALRTADGSTDNYYGVTKVSYSSGTAGIGYIGAPTALGWDYLPSGSEVMAHELGHNWGRQHAPCGGVAGPDANFPYAGGAIGVFGFNVRTGALLANSTADLMGYCSPTWISDYTYRAVLNYRGSSAASIIASLSAGGAARVNPEASSVVQSNVAAPGLLVWGRIAADGAITLEPAVRLTTRSVLPAASGDYTMEALDANGSAVFSLSFAPDLVAVEEGAAERHFAFVVPVSDAAHASLRTLRVRGNGQSAQRVSRTTAAITAASDDATVESEGAGRARVRWDAADGSMVVVRDPATGQILSFARGGNAAVFTGNTDLELVYTDGVRSSSRRASVRGR